MANPNHGNHGQFSSGAGAKNSDSPNHPAYKPKVISSKFAMKRALAAADKAKAAAKPEMSEGAMALMAKSNQMLAKSRNRPWDRS